MVHCLVSLVVQDGRATPSSLPQPPLPFPTPSSSLASAFGAVERSLVVAYGWGVSLVSSRRGVVARVTSPFRLVMVLAEHHTTAKTLTSDRLFLFISDGQAARHW
jgi:hypothetical protein